jgi:predicted metal-dependent peptidase
MTALAKYETEDKRGTFTPCELTGQQLRLWTETRAAFLWNCPAFSHVLYTMMNPHGSEHIALFSKDVPIAATDGCALILNPDTFFKHSLAERIFIIAHEVMHGIWDHCGQMHVFNKRGEIRYADGTKLKYQPKTMNVATDLVINDCLIEAKVGQFNTAWLHDPKLVNGNDSAIDAYRKVYNDEQGGGGGSGKERGEGFDEHLPPGNSQGNGPDDAQSQRNDIEWKQAVAAGAAAAKAQGKLPAALEKFLGDILEPEVPWTDKIEAFFARKVGAGGYDWRRPDRRMITRDDPVYAPGRSGHAAGTVVVGIDTSGSIAMDPTIIDRFFAELSGILDDVRPKRLMVVWCDAKVHRVDEVEDAGDLHALRCKPVPGWGGTSFVPVFDYLAEHHITPDALVYLTDGDGSFPSAAPAYPVLWGDISKNAQKYPFGDVVECPIKKS